MTAKQFFKKKWVIITAIVLAAVLIGASIAMIILLPFKKGSVSGDVWYPTEQFNLEEDAVIIHKEAGKEFKILNLTDIQITFAAEIAKGTVIYKTITKAVEDTKPDLITITGDNAWGLITRQTVKALCKFLDSFGIPWAPVFGNHDEEGNADLNYLAEIYMASENCLFRKGPSNIGGVGNYPIVIMEGDKVVYTLVMMDSGSSIEYDEEGDDIYDYYVNNGYYCDSDEGKEYKVGKGYDLLQYSQVCWYKWVIEGIAAYSNMDTAEVKSATLFHIPLIQYHYAYINWIDSGKDESLGYVKGVNETIASAYVDSGMFDAITELGSTEFVIVGHDHINDFVLKYEGVTLVYGVKTGNACYWVEDGSINGGTLLTLDKDNKMSVEQHYVDYEYVK